MTNFMDLKSDPIISEIIDYVRVNPLFFYRKYEDLTKRLRELNYNLGDGIFIGDKNKSYELVTVTASTLCESNELFPVEEGVYNPQVKDYKIHLAIKNKAGVSFRRPSINQYKYNGMAFSGFIHGAPINFILKDDKAYIPKETNSESIIMLNLIGGIDRSFVDNADIIDNGAYCIFDNFSWTNFAHWSIDHFPRLLAIKQDEENFSIVFNNKPSDFHFSMLNLTGIEKSQIIHPDKKNNSFLYKFKKGFISTNLQNDFRHSLHHGSTFLLDKIRSFKNNGRSLIESNGLKLVIQRFGRGLYISEDVKNILMENNFIIVHPEYLPFEMQMNLFSNASHIISPHGAGLSNLMYCQEGTKVLELFNSTLGTHAFYTISNFIGLEYSSAISEYAKDSFKGIDARTSLEKDILLDWLNN